MDNLDASFLLSGKREKKSLGYTPESHGIHHHSSTIKTRIPAWKPTIPLGAALIAGITTLGERSEPDSLTAVRTPVVLLLDIYTTAD